MIRFSANLGFLWTELNLPQAIHAAGAFGFSAVECHWPYATPASQVHAALEDTGLPMLSLNTSPGDRDKGDFGLAAVVGREREARAAIEQALDYAAEVNADAVHVMAGKATDQAAEDCFVANLTDAVAKAHARGITILIEPINQWDAPGYFLNSLAQARRIINAVNHPSLKLMFDCYHVARTEDDVCAELRASRDITGHIQFAGVPDRGSPDTGTLNYAEVFETIVEIGWTTPIGAEYRPHGTTEESLGWMTQLAIR